MLYMMIDRYLFNCYFLGFYGILVLIGKVSMVEFFNFKKVDFWGDFDLLLILDLFFFYSIYWGFISFVKKCNLGLYEGFGLFLGFVVDWFVWFSNVFIKLYLLGGILFFKKFILIIL